ncbi:MAG: B12-binding domain-containing radical SAM protein [Negativicutes bacterium]|nr:B12-binding domain-containing radical SAM protein [Negativicutes bacterium]
MTSGRFTEAGKDERLVMNKQRIMLIDPPLFRFLQENQPAPPLGLCYIAGYLRQQGYDDVVIYNADYDPGQRLSECNRAFSREVEKFQHYRQAVTDDQHPLYKEIIDTVAGYRPDVIGLSSKTAKFYVLKKIAAQIKRHFPEVTVVAGGPHASSCPIEMLDSTAVDAVVIGEGEITFHELITALANGRDLGRVAGIGYRRAGRAVINQPRPLLENLDLLPFPAKDLVMHYQTVPADNMGGIFSSRGCPFACSFCDARSVWTRRVRRRSPANIVAEIIQIREKYGTSFFTFSDDCFVTDQAHLSAFCRELQASGLPGLPRRQFRWWCEIHPRLVSQPVVEAIAAAGCVAVAIGVESASEKTMQLINKKSSRQLVKTAARIIKQAGLNLVVFCMIGFPWETREDIMETVEFMEELGPDSGNLSILTPLPNTEIYNYCQERGLINYDADYLNCFHQREAGFFSDLISYEESRAVIREAFARVDNIIEKTRADKIADWFNRRFGEGTAASNYAGQRRPLLVSQSYADQTIEVAAADDHQWLTGDGPGLARQLFDHFPQYRYLRLTVAGCPAVTYEQ